MISNGEFRISDFPGATMAPVLIDCFKIRFKSVFRNLKFAILPCALLIAPTV